MKEGWLDKYFTSSEEHVTKIKGEKIHFAKTAIIIYINTFYTVISNQTWGLNDTTENSIKSPELWKRFLQWDAYDSRH